MKKKEINVLFIADIIGKPGLEITSSLIAHLKKKHRVDLCIANGENGAAGKGLSDNIAKTYFSLGIDVITSGNHIWDNRNFHTFLAMNNNVLRPYNYPEDNIGRGYTIVNILDQIPVLVLNLQGKTFMFPIDCPFRAANEVIDKYKDKIKIFIIDFHAEASAEKMALGWYLDGKASAVIGTHTHVQTADEQILPRGTAYITDAGMTGPFDSVIGMKKQIAIQRFLKQIPIRYQPATDNVRLCGVLISINVETGKASSIQRLQLP
ncbi:TIGR00282 family metallophosphoesterase [candidate division KSB1 bacterium]|nr:TIGR00282 family metallophosphoesterase [candidate division KSB1 bacterium]